MGLQENGNDNNNNKFEVRTEIIPEYREKRLGEKNESYLWKK